MAPHPQLYGAYFSTHGTTKHWNNTVFRNFSTLSLALIFFLLPFSSLIFSLLPFSSRTALPTVAASVHIGGSYTSKLPSVIFCPPTPRSPGLFACRITFCMPRWIAIQWWCRPTALASKSCAKCPRPICRRRPQRQWSCRPRSPQAGRSSEIFSG